MKADYEASYVDMQATFSWTGIPVAKTATGKLLEWNDGKLIHSCTLVKEGEDHGRGLCGAPVFLLCSGGWKLTGMHCAAERGSYNEAIFIPSNQPNVASFAKTYTQLDPR